MKKTKVLSVRVPIEVIETLDELAETESSRAGNATHLEVRISRSAVLARVIDIGLEVMKEDRHG